jgi:hypothetical protein
MGEAKKGLQEFAFKFILIKLGRKTEKINQPQILNFILRSQRLFQIFIFLAKLSKFFLQFADSHFITSFDLVQALIAVFQTVDFQLLAGQSVEQVCDLFQARLSLEDFLAGNFIVIFDGLLD